VQWHRDEWAASAALLCTALPQRRQSSRMTQSAQWQWPWHCRLCLPSLAGLKNKNKSKKVQQYVKAVETSVAFAGQSSQSAGAAAQLTQSSVAAAALHLCSDRTASDAVLHALLLSKLFSPRAQPRSVASRSA